MAAWPMPETQAVSDITHFLGGPAGRWRVMHARAVIEAGLPLVDRLDVTPAAGPFAPAGWALRGFVSNQRYTTRTEDDALKARQAGLGRAEATCAALIPIRKSDAWWQLAQDERRAIFEERSHHGAIGLDYLPGIARRLFHGRDIGEPFDFLTWFEFAPDQAAAFDALLHRLRATEEWSFVERETELRLERDPG